MKKRVFTLVGGGFTRLIPDVERDPLLVPLSICCKYAKRNLKWLLQSKKKNFGGALTNRTIILEGIREAICGISDDEMRLI